jgi:cytochrome c peroxidase
MMDDGDLTKIAYDSKAYILEYPQNFPKMIIPEDNPLTQDGVNLGRHLFYDPILSGDSTMSCATCHRQELAFTDGGATSKGIEGIDGTRSSMSLVNIGFSKNGLFWDGRSKTLEAQAALPVEDAIELNANWTEIEKKLRLHKIYPTLFRKAFGISNKTEITKELATKAIAQFERTIVSSDSKYDKFLRGEVILSDEEYQGYLLYFDIQGDGIPDAQCNHCHPLDLAGGDGFFNNGLQNAPTLADFNDLGRGRFTASISDNGKFKAATLRNIMQTGPYMHDGSLKMIDDVLNHYKSGGKPSPNRDPLVINNDINKLTEYDLFCIKTFLSTLTDSTVLKNPNFSSPF